MLESLRNDLGICCDLVDFVVGEAQNRCHEQEPMMVMSVQEKDLVARSMEPWPVRSISGDKYGDEEAMRRTSDALASRNTRMKVKKCS